MANIEPKERLKTVQYYLENRNSLRKTAQQFGFHYVTVFKWVKLYKEQGEERLLSNYKRPWNRTEKELEQKIVVLKERTPSLTVRKAKEILQKQDINISIKGIWGIWKRYGYTGFRIENMSNDFIDYLSWTREATRKFERAKDLYKHGDIKKTAEILNSVPALPKNELILQIPDSYLNLKRQIEKMSPLFGKIPLASYLKRTRNLYEKCKKTNLCYSAIRLGIYEVLALSWHGKPMDQLKKIEGLKRVLQKTEDHACMNDCRHVSSSLLALTFSLLILEAGAYGSLLKMKQAFQIARSCGKLLKRRKYILPLLMLQLGRLYEYLENFREAEYWYLKAWKKLDKETRKLVLYFLADISTLKGDYKKAINILKNADLKESYLNFTKVYSKSIWHLINGLPCKTISLLTQAVSFLKKEKIQEDLFHASLTIASSYCSLGEKRKAERILKKLYPFLVKSKLKRQIYISEILLSCNQYSKFHMPLNQDISPCINLALLLKNGNYRKAFKYANKKGILSYLHRYIFFFPETINNLIEKGKSTGLPKAILKLPVFNKKIPVYSIKFLGKLVVSKNQKYLNVKLPPKDTSFLIYLALNAEEPEKKIPLEDLYNNFWKNTTNCARNLSYLLVRIKKALKIPSHLLEISYKKDNPVLINRGIHFITDYQELKQALASAQAFKRGGEWSFAKKEYLRVFKLFRGEPFKKMYDDWSDDKRLEILFRYENEVLSFANQLVSRGRKEEAEKLLKNAERIVPYSDEIKDLLADL